MEPKTRLGSDRADLSELKDNESGFWAGCSGELLGTDGANPTEGSTGADCQVMGSMGACGT